MKWTLIERYFLMQYSRSMSHKEIATALGRSIPQVQTMIMRLGLGRRKQTKWNDDEVKFLIKNNCILSRRDIAEKLKKPISTIHTKCKILNLPNLHIGDPEQKTKICTRCKVEKDTVHFRLRNENRRGHCTYRNSVCKKCEGEVTNQSYFAKKDNPEFKKKWLQKSNEYYHANVEEIKKRNKIKRQTPEYKAMMKAYREKNKDKIREQEVTTKKRYHEKNRDNISDKYVLGRLNIPCSELESVKQLLPEIIELKRLKIQLDREIRNHQKSTNTGARSDSK